MKAAKDHPHYEWVINNGLAINADWVMFLDGRFWQYYRAGSFATRGYLECMPIRKGAQLGWRNSYNVSVDQTRTFYENLKRQVEIIDLRNLKKSGEMEPSE